MSTPTKIKAAPWLADDLEALYRDPVFLAEDLILDVMEKVHQIMAEQGIKQKDLADKLGKSRSAISQMLSGDQNISLHRLMELAVALGMVVAPLTFMPLTTPEIETADLSVEHGMVVGSVQAQSNRQGLWSDTPSPAATHFSPTTFKVEQVSLDRPANDYAESSVQGFPAA